MSVTVIDPKTLEKVRFFGMPDAKETFAYASGTSVGLVGSKQMNINVSNKGISMNGPVSIGATPENIRIGVFWTLNPLLMSTVPSTMITPIPTFIFNPPGVQLAKDVGVAVASIAAISAVVGA